MNNGIILLNKPTNMSSNKAVNIIKKLVGANKAGHLGTLDPLGTGVLPVTINKATKLFDYYLNKVKRYRAIFVFGYETDTLDSEGEVVNKNDKIVSEEELLTTIEKFIGEINQMPPKYSSKKINGEKAYELVRNNVDFTLTPKLITIYNLELVNKMNKNVYTFDIECSSGTYIRSLARDMATELGTYGTMVSIIRTRCGNFKIDNTYTLEEISNKEYEVLSMENCINLEKLEIEDKYLEDLKHGRKIEIINTTSEDFKLYCSGEFFGIANISNNILNIKTYLRSDNE